MLLADDSWPASREVFVNTLSHANAGAQVWLGPHGRIEVMICRHIGAMYCHLSRVYWQIQDAFADASDADRPAPEVTQPFLGLVKDQIQPFEAWPRGKIAQMVAPDPIDDVSTHPMASAARTTPSALSSYLRRVRRTCGLAPPVQSDVWLRLLFNMLPVNSRFVYLQRQRPDAICCGYGCGAAESQQHSFYDCEVVHHVWAFYAALWRDILVEHDFGH